MTVAAFGRAGLILGHNWHRQYDVLVPGLQVGRCACSAWCWCCIVCVVPPPPHTHTLQVQYWYVGEHRLRWFTLIPQWLPAVVDWWLLQTACIRHLQGELATPCHHACTPSSACRSYTHVYMHACRQTDRQTDYV